MSKSVSLLTPRHELKYLLEPALARLIRAHVQPFTRPDAFAARCADYRYPVTSLYLDTPDLYCFEATNQRQKTRFKPRIRIYSDDLREPAYFEVKLRLGKMIRKSRMQVSRAALADFFAGRERWSLLLEDGSQTDFDDFVRLCDHSQVGPVVWVRYQREAYEGLGRDAVRINFDTDLERAVAENGVLTTAGTRWKPTPLEGVVLELKFHQRCPAWVTDMIRRFQLERLGVCKYARALHEALANGERTPPARATAEPTSSASLPA